MQLEFWQWFIVGVVLAIFSTWLLKKFTKIETHLIYSIWRIKRFAEFIKKQKRYRSFVDALAQIGSVIGFGVLASDFFFARKKKPWKRITVDTLTVLTLGTIYYLTLLYPTALSPITKPFWIPLALSFSFFGIAGFLPMALLSTGIDIIFRVTAGKAALPGVGPLIPGVKVPGMPIFIPWYGWIAIFVSMVIHEASHGIQMMKEKIKIEGAGFLLVGVFPLGAFVEPNEKQLEKASEEKKVKVYSAGPSANFLSMIPFYIILFLVSTLLVAPAAQAFLDERANRTKYIEVVNVPEKMSYGGKEFSSPAYGELEAGMKILEVEGTKIKTQRDLEKALSNHRFEPTDFLVEKNGQRKRVTITPEPLLGMYGFDTQAVYKEGLSFPQKEHAWYQNMSVLGSFFAVMFLIAFLLGVANFMPVIPFDGGKIAPILFAPVLKPLIESKEKREKIIRKTFTLALLVLILVNILPLFL